MSGQRQPVDPKAAERLAQHFGTSPRKIQEIAFGDDKRSTDDKPWR